MSIIKQSTLILVAIAITAALVILLLMRPSQVIKQPEERRAIFVDVIEVVPQSHQVIIEGSGTVQADQLVRVAPEVSGQIVEVSKQLVKGGLVQKGELLCKIDPRDYQNQVEQEEAAVERAFFDWKVEQGRQVVAQREWEELHPSIERTELSEELALRKPHLKEKKVALEAAKSRLEKAQNDLKRTEIRAVMEAVVIDETVEVGDYVTPQREIARLAGVEAFRVQVSVPVRKLEWIDEIFFASRLSLPAKVIQNMGGGKEEEWDAKVVRLLGDLEESGRMARVLVLVEDPLNLKSKDSSQTPLLIGSYVKVIIEGPEIEKVYLVPSEAIRGNNKIWIRNQEGELEIRTVNILSTQKRGALIDQGLEKGDEVIISPISTPLPGMPLRTDDE